MFECLNEGMLGLAEFHILLHPLPFCPSLCHVSVSLSLVCVSFSSFLLLPENIDFSACGDCNIIVKIFSNSVLIVFIHSLRKKVNILCFSLSAFCTNWVRPNKKSSTPSWLRVCVCVCATCPLPSGAYPRDSCQSNWLAICQRNKALSKTDTSVYVCFCRTPDNTIYILCVFSFLLILRHICYAILFSVYIGDMCFHVAADCM